MYYVGKQEEASQLVELLRVTGDLEEQGDILHYMTEQYGLSFKVWMLGRTPGKILPKIHGCILVFFSVFSIQYF
jgi:hypothetical protein